jgi:acyl-CoA thioesterase
VPHEFDQHIAVIDVGDGTYAAELSPGWEVGGHINGGYLLAVLGNAVAQTLPAKPDPISISAYYLSASVPGPAQVTARVLREGGSLATVAAELRQGDEVRLTALATYGSLADAGGEVPAGWAGSAAPPDLPHPDECVPGTMAPPEVLEMAPFVRRFDVRFDHRMVGWALGQPSGRGEMQAWLRLADGREPDPVSLLMAVDSLPPVSMDLGRTGWAPTLELTAYVRAVPAPGWLRVRHATRFVQGGMFEEDCEVWDSTDRLVAQSRQLARLPRS